MRHKSYHVENSVQMEWLKIQRGTHTHMDTPNPRFFKNENRNYGWFGIVAVAKSRSGSAYRISYFELLFPEWNFMWNTKASHFVAVVAVVEHGKSTATETNTYQVTNVIPTAQTTPE